ncbi:hypothetical protein [Rhodococcus sp. SJ-2]
MITDQYIATATKVLAKCSANDPWFPNGGEATVMAWAECFADSRLSEEDLLAGVARAYRTAEEGFKPLPAAIVKHARAAYFEQLEALPRERRLMMEEATHILQDMGIPAPDAHRFARRVALGRSTPFRLTDEQDAEFRRLMVERRELTEDPRKAIVGSYWFKGLK